MIRDGAGRFISASELVTGDVVVLDAGDRVCAELRLQHAESLAIDESMLTGESAPVHPEVGDAARAGTFVVEGTGRGIVTATGAATRLADIARLTATADRPASPLTI